MNKKHVKLSIILFILIQCLVMKMAWGHGGGYPKPSEQEKKLITKPIEGSEKFIRVLAEQSCGLLTPDQGEKIDLALRHFNFADGIRQGRYHDAQEIDAEYNCWLAEKILCELMTEMSNVLVFNFSPQAKLPDPHKVIPFDTQSGSILLKAETGVDVKRFVCQDFGMHQERYDRHYEIPVDPDGITYIFQSISQPPPGKSSTHIAFRKINEPKPFYWHALTLDVQPAGQLQVAIKDENGQTTSALVRLKALPSGKLWAPSEAIDFRPMINEVTGTSIDALPGLNIYGPGRAFMVRMPGKFAGHYWVIPKPFEMALPAGKWEITVFRGIETIPVRKTFEIQSNKFTRETIHLKRWTDMAEKGWYSGDDHVHSRMTSSEDAEKLVALTQAMDVRVSNILEMGDPQRTYYIQRGFGKDFRVENSGHWLVPGQEDPRSILGHNIGLNLTSMARDLDRYLMLDWIAETIHRQGGLFGQTHVGQNACEVHRGMALMAPRGIYDFYSVMQGGLGTQLYYDFLDLGYQLTASAGSDTPYGGTLGNVRLYAFAGEDKLFDPDNWYNAIKKGRTFVTNGPMLELTVNGAMPGDEILVDDEQPLTIKARAWGLKGQSAPTRLEVVKLSDVIKTVMPAREDDTELSVSFTIEPDRGFWIAARADGRNGSQAHTTPVYIKYPGRRHWNLARVETIIKRQMMVLDEIEGVIADAEKAKRDGTLLHVDYWGLRSVQQADAVRERLGISRNLYKDLLKEFHKQQDVQ